jgi:hypothetical protein
MGSLNIYFTVLFHYVQVPEGNNDHQVPLLGKQSAYSVLN